MGVIVTPESELGRELAKWEQHHTQYTVGTSPGNPYVFRPYPKMLYRAQRLPNGQPSVGEVPPHPMYFPDPAAHERQMLWIESFNKSCQRIVKDEAEERIAAGQGWSVTQQAALERYEHEQQSIGQAAAEAAYTAQRMSEKARAEYADAQQQTSEHVTDVVPKRKRGRPAKGVTAVTEKE